jgi:hypothetical protein
MEQNYLIIENNVVTNIVVWDGNPGTWTPPADSIQLVDSTTPAMIWVPDSLPEPTKYVLTQVDGAGRIGFTWNGTVLMTNQPEPVITPPNP